MIYEFLLAILIAYLLGSIPSGVIASRIFAGRDVRDNGSGHTGALNTYRVAGIFPAALAFLADLSKTVIAVELARYLTGDAWSIAFAGIAAVLGHCYPIYTRFRGGMGLAAGATVLFLLDAPILIALMLAWLVLKLVLKKSPRASAIVALLLPVFLILTHAETPLIVFGFAVGAIICLRHLPDWNRQLA